MIGSIGGGSPSSAQYLSQIFNKLDSNGDGSIDAAELGSAIKNSGSKTSAGIDSKKLFSQIDANGDGKISESEFSSFARTLMAKRGGARGAGRGGEGGPHGMPAGGGHRASATSSTDSTGKTYDPKDTNKDGVVSLQEEALYDMMHPGSGTSSTSGITTPVTSYDSSGTGAAQTSPGTIDFFA